MPLSRVLIIANKTFEADPLMDVITDVGARPPQIKDTGTLVWPRLLQTKMSDIIVRPRCAVNIGGDFVLEIWCIQDLMNPYLSYGNTAEKVRVLPQIFQYGKEPDFVMAFGTAASPVDQPVGGNVVIGPDIFIHNPSAANPNPTSAWNDPAVMEKRLVSSVDSSFLTKLTQDTAFQSNVTTRFLTPPLSPADPVSLNIVPEGVAVGDVNVINTADYATADPESLAAAAAAGAVPAVSMETTHGVTRSQSPAPFLFISGITNQVGKFDTQVLPRFYAQNFVASHNAGVAAVWLVPEIIALLKG